MWALRQVISYLWSVATSLETAGARCDAVPAVGSYIGYPFHLAAGYLQNAAWSLYDFDTWSDNLKLTADAAYQNALTAYNYAYGSLSSQVTSAWQTAQDAYQYAAGTVWQTARNAQQTADQVLQYATTTLNNAVLDAQNRATAALNYAEGYLSSQVSQALQNANTALYGLTSLSGRIGEVAWSWITSGYLQTFLDTWKTGLLDTVISLVTSSMGYLIDQAFQYLDNHWQTFKNPFTWLMDRLLDLVLEKAGHFAPVLWSVVEEVLKHLTEWRE